VSIYENNTNKNTLKCTRRLRAHETNIHGQQHHEGYGLGLLFGSHSDVLGFVHSVFVRSVFVRSVFVFRQTVDFYPRTAIPAKTQKLEQTARIMSLSSSQCWAAMTDHSRRRHYRATVYCTTTGPKMADSSQPFVFEMLDSISFFNAKASFGTIAASNIRPVCSRVL
jgi:hypothetical protein